MTINQLRNTCGNDVDLPPWYWWRCSQLAGSSCSSSAFRPNYFTYLMYGHGLVDNGRPLLVRCQTWPFTLPSQCRTQATPLEGMWVWKQNASECESVLLLRDRAGGLRLIPLAGKISSAPA